MASQLLQTGILSGWYWEAMFYCESKDKRKSSVEITYNLALNQNLNLAEIRKWNLDSLWGDERVKESSYFTNMNTWPWKYLI